jgi:prophage antirepressor-like protein
MKTVSVMLDQGRLDYIIKSITPGAREFSKWVRDAIDLRIAMESEDEPNANTTETRGRRGTDNGSDIS